MLPGMKNMKDPRQTFGFVWAAELCAPALYVVIGHVAVKTAAGGDAAEMNTVGAAFMALGAAAFVAGLLLPQIMLKDDAIRKKGSKQAALQYVLTFGMVSLGLFETVPIIALVWSFISRELKYLVPSAAVAMIAIIFIRGQIIACFDHAETLFPNE